MKKSVVVVVVGSAALVRGPGPKDTCGIGPCRAASAESTISGLYLPPKETVKLLVKHRGEVDRRMPYNIPRHGRELTLRRRRETRQTRPRDLRSSRGRDGSFACLLESNRRWLFRVLDIYQGNEAKISMRPEHERARIRRHALSSATTPHAIFGYESLERNKTMSL